MKNCQMTTNLRIMTSRDVMLLVVQING